MYLYGNGIFYKNVLIEGDHLQYKNKSCTTFEQKQISGLKSKYTKRFFKYNTLSKKFEMLDNTFFSCLLSQKHL